MALFDVPGWSVPSVPARSHEKRKRPTDGEGKSQAAVINFDKLVKKLGTDRPVSEDSASTKPARQPKQRRRISDDGQRALSPETSLDTAIQKPEPRPTGVNPENTPGGGRKERKRKHKPTREADRNGAPKGNAVKEESPLRPSRPPTKMGRKSKPDEHNSPAAPPPSTVPKEHETVEKVGLTLLQKGMKHSLDGARFR
jgi:ribosomal RNA-processing protein 8